MSRPRVLAIDDEPALRKLISRALEPDCDVEAVASAEAAMRSIRTERFDVILCDLMMPTMNGMEFYEEFMRERPIDADRIIFLSGGAYSPAALKFLRRVPNLRVDKPFNAAELKGTVMRHALEHGSDIGTDHA
jgi:CheY-like chemotaxis protein